MRRLALPWKALGAVEEMGAADGQAEIRMNADMAEPAPHWKWGAHRRERLCHVSVGGGVCKVRRAGERRMDSRERLSCEKGAWIP